jgi:GNAT superfamily N-acetyltransferase
MSAELRQAHREDIPAMHRIRLAVRENRLTSSAVQEHHYVPEIEVTGRGWVVVDDGEVVAFAVGNAQTANIWALFVSPDHERQGHGRRLLEVMVEWLFAQGVQSIWLSTDPNSRARGFYEAAGWSFRRMLPDGEHYFELQRAGTD